jgi:gliding motility-associated-like protein
MELYRDCQASNAAFFDSQAHLTVFRGNSTPYTELFVERSGYVGPVDIDPPSYPCLSIPPNVCVHKAQYQYDLELEISAESYHIVWQRCCRNQSISNIYDPGDIGATFTVEITPPAQLQCNNSPRFNMFPPTVVCVDAPLIFDHSATDKEGDNIVYEFCAPLIGGGLNFRGNGCDSPNPNPDCPPPFGTVTFRSPTYTSSYPMGGSPRVTIDRVTGMITGTPTTQGQFVVGVCVKEYRNGVLLSTIRRDFQFNVSTCTPNFKADLRFDELGPNNEYVLKSCDSKTLKIFNRSSGRIDSILWVVDMKDSIIYDRKWNPEFTFPQGGLFTGKLIINPFTPCSDTADLLFKIVEDINADFVAVYDTCVAGPVAFTDMSFDKGSTLTSWDWDFSARLSDTAQNPVVEYEEAGDYLVRLIIEDAFGCKDTSSQVLSWKPAPDIIIIEPTVEEGCSPLEVGFQNLSFPIDDEYNIVWKYSDSLIQSGLSPSRIFNDTGIYSLKVEITSPIGCYAERYFNNIIQVFHPPLADFTTSSQILNIFDNNVDLKDISRYSMGREWLIDNVGVYYDPELALTFADTGLHIVKLIAVDRFGCTDTLIKYIDVAPRNPVHFPNAFSPNGDGKNDVYIPVGLVDGIRDYNLSVYSRWGQLLFETDDIMEAWNGRLMNTGKNADPGVYVMYYQYTKPRGEIIESKGYITLVR